MGVKILNNQFYILLSFFVAGISIGILFDIFRISRRAFKTPNILIYIEDTLFWILAGLVVLFTICNFTDGQIRLYMILMLLLGAIIYFTTVSSFFIKINTKVLDWIKNAINMLLYPIRKITRLFNKLLKIKIFSKNSGK